MGYQTSPESHNNEIFILGGSDGPEVRLYFRLQSLTPLIAQVGDLSRGQNHRLSGIFLLFLSDASVKP